MEQQNSLSNFFDLRIDEESRTYLLAITKWAKIIAIIGFISPAVSLFAAVIGRGAAESDVFSFGFKGANIFGILIVAVISVILNLYLYKFSINTAESLETMSQETFGKGTNNLRLYFKMMGILIIVGLSLVILGTIIFVLGMGLAMR